MPQPRGWQFVATSATATGTVSLSIAMPTGTVDNDIMHMFLSHRGAGFATMPAGWTLVDQDVLPGGIRGEWYWRRASGDAGPYSVTDLADSAVGYISSFRGGLLAGDIIDAQLKRVNASGADGTGPLTTGVANALVIMFNARAVQYGGGPTAGCRPFDPELNSLSTLGAAFNNAGSDAALDVFRQLKVVPGSTISDVAIITDSNGPAENLCIVASFIPETGGATAGSRYYLTYDIPVLPRREPWFPDGDWTDGFIDLRPADTAVASTSLLSQQINWNGYSQHNTGNSTQLVTNQQGDFDAFYRRFVTPPLQAQTLAGTFQCTLGLNARWKNDLGVLSNDTVARLKVHGYVTVGQTAVVRSVIPSLDNLVDAADINNANNDIVWTGLSAPASLVGVEIEEGDSIVIEIGIRIVSSLTPTPTYPPTSWSQISLYALGTSLVASDDAVIGNVAGASQVNPAHFDFTDTILEQDWVPDSPTNISPATATDIVSMPFSQVETPYNAHGSSANARSVWYKHTATRTGTLICSARGTMGFVDIHVFTGASSAYSDLTQLVFPDILGDFSNSRQRCISVLAVEVTIDETYYIRLSGNPEPRWAGWGYVASFSLAYQEEPATGDKFIPNVNLYAYRGHAMVNFNHDYASFFPTGCAIDYTRREMDAFPEPNTNYRLFFAMFSTPVVEIVDLTTLSRDTSEIDFISDPFELVSGRFSTHLAALHMTRAGGFVYVQAMGNGFLYVIGLGSGVPADLVTFSNFDDLGYIRGIDGLHADNQPGAPWPLASELAAEREQTEPWAGGLNQLTGVLAYASGGLYLTLPVAFPTTTGDGQIAKQFNVFADTQGADLATLPAIGLNHGLKNMCVAADGSVFITNGSQVRRVHGSTGALIQTYTPISDYPVSLIDCQLEPDGIHFSTIDQNTIDIFTFNISTGVQTDRVRTWGSIRSFQQFAIFTPDEIPVTIPPLETEIRYKRRQRTVPHLSDEQKIFRYNRLQLDCMTGIGTTEGQGIDPVVYMSMSDDGGHRWTDEYAKTAGRLGDYKHEVTWRRLGSSRDRVFNFVMSDPVKWVLLDAYIELQKGTT